MAMSLIFAPFCCHQNVSISQDFWRQEQKCTPFLGKDSTFLENFEENRIYNPVVFTAVNVCSIR